MKKIVFIIVFGLIIIVQWAVPAKLVLEQEDTLKNGTVYHFKTRPIDPTDPFRGKYIVLDYEVNSAACTGMYWDEESSIYVYLEEDAEGFAKVARVSPEKLDTNKDYVLAKYNRHNDSALWFQLPFNRFYMEESKAYDAELAVRNAQRDSLPNNCYAAVLVKGKNAVLKDVFIDDIPIQKYVERMKETGSKQP